MPEVSLIGAALSVGIAHTVIGPDHYLPFIVLSRAEGWPLRKTLLWTALCGVAHVLSSVLIGGIGIALGWTLGSMESIESHRGTIAGYVLLLFGVVYFVWGIWRARGHSHVHTHIDGSVHKHAHKHDASLVGQHGSSAHDDHASRHRRTVWTLFLIFVLGPCEPLIPLLLVPAAAHNPWAVASVASLYGLATLVTMLVIVTAGVFGLRLVRFRSMERYAHASAGFVLAVSGSLVVFGL